MLKDASTLPTNPFTGRDPKEVWKELLDNSVPVDKSEFMKRVENHFSKQNRLHTSKK